MTVDEIHSCFTTWKDGRCRTLEKTSFNSINVTGSYVIIECKKRDLMCEIVEFIIYSLSKVFLKEAEVKKRVCI